MNVRTLCLGILQFDDATGYEIKKKVEQGMFSHFIEASYGSIYPALTQMSEEGLLTCRRESQSGRPDKKVYAITAQGRAALVEAIRETPGADKFKSQFLFVMLLGELLPGDHCDRIVDQRLSEMRRELDHIRHDCGTCRHDGSRFVAGYGIAVFEAAIRYLENHRAQGLAAGTNGARANTRQAPRHGEMT